LLSARQIPPGGNGEIEVKVHTDGLSGRMSKSVVVLCNDPRQPEVRLSVTAVVEPEFSLSERAIFFGSVPRGQEASKEVTVTIPADKSLKLLSVESTDRNVAVRMEPVAGSGDKKMRIVASRKSDASEGYHFGIIVVRTSSTYNPEIKIPVRGMVSAP